MTAVIAMSDSPQGNYLLSQVRNIYNTPLLHVDAVQIAVPVLACWGNGVELTLKMDSIRPHLPNSPILLSPLRHSINRVGGILA